MGVLNNFYFYTNFSKFNNLLEAYKIKIDSGTYKIISL